MSSPHLIVVGAGLAGLVAGLEAVDLGARVTVLEAAGHAGGRAHTSDDDGFRRNLGPHAVYRSGALARELARLGVAVPGRSPALTRAWVCEDGRRLPRRSVARVAIALPRLLARPPRPGTTVSEWLDAAPLAARERSLVLALVRTATYAHAPDRQDAAAAHAQLRVSLAGVSYPHGGWARLATGLLDRLGERGAVIRRGAPVRTVEHDERVRAVELADGESLPADGVVVAVGGPGEAARLLTGPVAERLRRRDDVPIHMATLDVALDGLPRRWPAQVLGDGNDPRYWLAPSRFADLAPSGGEVVHVARYLAPGERADATTRADLEAWFDELQPGWRARVRHARFLPALTVTHALPLAAHDGLAGRVPVRTGVRGLALAGDGVGPTGHLADAAAASAVAAARAVVGDATDRVDRTASSMTGGRG